MVGHRASVANSLFNACKLQRSIKFNFSTSLVEIKHFTGKPTFIVQPRTGEPQTVKFDVLLAADGIKSVARSQMLKELNFDANVQDTGQAAYRILLSKDKIVNDPELLELINSDSIVRWIGEKRHIIAYPVSSKTIYNISTIQPDTAFAAAPEATYTTKGSKTKMMEIFDDFCPKIKRMLNLVPDGEVCEWKLRIFGSLPTWVHGCVGLVGDAAHPTLPHLNQGAAQAIEDAAVLSVVLSKLPNSDPESIHKALKIYELVRKERAETLVQLAAASGRALHLGEGAAKDERDKQFAALKQGKGSVPDKWADAEVQKMIYGHDCMDIAEKSFHELFDSFK